MYQEIKGIRWENLMHSERITRCRMLASEALTRANSTTPPMKQHYLDLAAEWHRLADDMEMVVG